MLSQNFERSERPKRRLSRSRSRSPQRHSEPRSSRKHNQSTNSKIKALPLGARPLRKHDYEKNRALFALYLDMQKQIYIEDLDERETKGRWKSFLGKWNRGELAEGWYDPTTREKAASAAVDEPPNAERRASPDYGSGDIAQDMASRSEDDDFGPVPPTAPGNSKAGPVMPSLQDLEYRNELLTDDQRAAHEDLAYARKQDRRTQKERLEELVPRTDPGSRERQLEKKRKVTSTLSSFREQKEAGVEEVAEADLLGDDGADAFKRRKKDMEKKKTERELRKEEVWRVRAEERHGRLTARKEKEDQTMDMFKALAKQRFG